MKPRADNLDRDLLRQVPLFSRLEEPLLEQLADCCRRKRLRANVAVFLMGDQGQTLFMIISGTVRIERSTLAGKTIQLAQRATGDHFGEMALLDGKPRMADAITMTSCDFLVLERTDFLQCLYQSPQIAVSMMASLAERLREAADHQEQYQGRDVLGRLAAALVAQAAGQSSEEKSLGPEAPKMRHGILISYHRQDLAEQLGTTPESISRAISTLCASRILEKQGRNILQVLHLAKLRERAAQSF